LALFILSLIANGQRALGTLVWNTNFISLIISHEAKQDLAQPLGKKSHQR